jgi:hypothetical protein
MSEILSTWPVVVELPLRADDRDADGFVTHDGIERLFAEARAAYAAECPELDLDAATIGELVLQRGAVEVFPDTFTMDLRIRPAEGRGIAGSASCVVAPAGGVADELRSRLIALAQTARHYH